MSDLESNKNLAGIGSILLIFPFVSIIGVILIYLGLKGIAEYYREDSIRSDGLRGIIFLIIAAIAVAVVVPFTALSGVFSIFSFGAFGIGLGFFTFIAMIVLIFVFYLLAAINIRKAFNTLAQKSGEHMFETAGMLLFFGAIFTIILVGFLLIFIAWIIATIAFFSIKVPPQQYGYTSPPPPAQLPSASRYCSNCGAPQDANATFCRHCGSQLPPT